MKRPDRSTWRLPAVLAVVFFAIAAALAGAQVFGSELLTYFAAMRGG